MKRRTFLKTVGSAAGVAALGVPKLFGANDAAETAAGLPRRVMGRTGHKVSVVGFPGLSLTHCDDQEQSTTALRHALDLGVNYFDVAPNYGHGLAEARMGIGLQGIDRANYFLACKTHLRDKEGARQDLERSLKLLKTDHFDLYQLHHVVRPAEVTQVLGPGGAMETILKAKEDGKIKALGFSAHTTKGALEAMKQFKFDTVMFPINFVEFYNRGFGKEIMALAKEQGAAVISIKPLSWGTYAEGTKKDRDWWYRSVEQPKQVELAVRFALSQPGVVSVLPTSFVDLFERAVEAAKAFTPLDDSAVGQLKEMAANRESLFIGEEKQVALNRSYWQPVHPDSPHECA